jgi:hypothetical protein
MSVISAARSAAARDDQIHAVEEAERSQEGPVSLVFLAHLDNLMVRFNNALAKREEDTDLGQMPSLEWVNVDQLWIDPDYQRTMRIDHVMKIALEFSWEKFQALSVMRRHGDDGIERLMMTDGQHKGIAAYLRDIKKVPCLIYQSQGKTDEAEQFFGINNDRRAVPLVVKHRNAVLLGRRDSIELQDIVDKAGITLTEGRPKRPGEFNNLSALRVAVRKAGEDITLRGFELMRRAWPEEPVNGIILVGLAVFIVLYHKASQYSEDDLVRTLKSFATPAAIMEGIDARRQATNIVRENLIASDLLEAYNQVNRRHGSGRLKRGPIANILARRNTTPAQLSHAASIDLPDEEAAQQVPMPRGRRKKQDPLAARDTDAKTLL